MSMCLGCVAMRGFCNDKQGDEMTQLRISFGAMSPQLSEQLKEFNIENSETIEHMQKDINALNRVRIRGLIAPSQVANGEKKLFKKITKLVEKHWS